MNKNISKLFTTDTIEQKFNRIKAKVLTMGRMAIMLKTVKENQQVIKDAKLALNTTKLPPGTLGSSGNADDVKQHVEHFIN